MTVLVLVVVLAAVGLVGVLGVPLLVAGGVIVVALLVAAVFGPQVLEAIALERRYRDPHRGGR